MITSNYVFDESVARECIYGADFVKEILTSGGINNIYIPDKYYSISNKKLEGMKRLAEYRDYYQENPVRFIKDFFNIQLLDSQAYLMMSAWRAQVALILGARAFGKSFWSMLFVMTKQMLSCGPWNCYVAAGSGQQSATTFKKLEDIANDRIDSLLNSNGKLFKDEVVINAANTDGFSHNPAGFEYKLYNDSFLKSLNSSVNKNRGARSNCVIFDEVGWLDPDLLSAYGAFCAVDRDFKTGVDEDGNAIDIVKMYAYPKEIQNQLIYVSSASSTDTEFYRMYREFSKKMIAGDPNYFVADIDCEMVMKPTVDGKPMKPALTRERINAALSTNPQKARREYFNLFSSDGGENAIIRRGVITRNEEVRLPIFGNSTGDKKYIITYDPARIRDNSVVLVGELYNDAQVGDPADLKVRLASCFTLMDVGKKIKSPMMIPDQIEYLRKLILEYDGGTENYDNIVGIWIDGGSGGGGGSSIPDLLMQSWTTSDGVEHKGLIDREYSSEYVQRFPNAVNKVHIMSPAGYKSMMYEALIEMLNQDKISFTATYDNNGSLTIFDMDDELIKSEKAKIDAKLKKKGLSGEQYDKKMIEELTKVQTVSSKVVKLDWQEELALANIDSLKEELVNICRTRRENGKDSFNLSPEKANKMHKQHCAYVA